MRSAETPENQALWKKFQRTYHVKLTSNGTFHRYRDARTFVITHFGVTAERDIRRVIFTRADEVIAKIKSAYSNVGTVNKYLSAYKMMFQQSRTANTSGDNPYVGSLDVVRAEIQGTSHPNTKVKLFRDTIAEKHSSFDEGLDKKLTHVLDEINAFLKGAYGCSSISEFNAKYSRSMNKKATLNLPIDTNIRSLMKNVNRARGVLAISLQAGEGHILRAECRTLQFFRPGGTVSRVNYVSISEKKIHINTYKTSRTYGAKDYNLRDRDVELLRFIRVFTESPYVFSTNTGKVANQRAFNRYYDHIVPGLTPTTLRKIMIDKTMRETPDTGNSEATRAKYYRIADED